ncbi:MAG TPA: protein translocase subunit SecDF [Sediminibacterium sp.]|uniref:protein translocase subunit SecDF n=1 Tax=Sediminibacterium sp. TaxID=1917865 RepID=UPI0008CCBF4F|nr:protein translocase subunit SecDF [Sediminibacterium sp.]OHC84349.1 MAG: protein translocase subunit SecDF [Sphingobacteriia bacterium RIFOXYC2_FULL_35_18]OHC88703.1 MAG: protein translocase subunit SecDF [Sphingobacteriia bacterium RIFOXYD2_FULL_35_12]HLD53963.1 protein translocase subunit SecDF [Sediminibacterium sp.]
MQLKGLVRFFAIALTLICLYQLSFTWFVNSHESAMEKKATEWLKRFPTAEQQYPGNKELQAAYTDSLEDLKKTRLLRLLDSTKDTKLAFGLTTYRSAKEKELMLGLDLQGGMSVTMEVGLDGLIKSLSNYTKDANFNKALDAAVARKANSGADLITLFLEEYSKVSPDGKLAPFFTTKSASAVKIEDSNAKVENYLRKQAEAAFNNTFRILRTRIDRFGVSSNNINPDPAKGRINIELAGVNDKDRVRNYLQSTANLQFFEVYTWENKDVQSGIVAADKAVQDYLTGADKVATVADTTKASSAVQPKGDTSKTATISSLASKATPAKTDSAAIKATENPILRLMQITQPYQAENGRPVYPAALGYIQSKDTGTLNDYLAMESVKSKFPSNLVFMYGKAELDDPKAKDILTLYAVKTLDNGQAELEGDRIAGASQDYDERGRIAIKMNMDKVGSNIWAKMTTRNVGKPIAIVLDNFVYSAPNVNDPITTGNSQISGNYTIKEAQDLSEILESGKLPAPAKIVQSQTVGPTLGSESIKGGALSFGISFLVIFALMLLYFNTGGWVANIALILNLLFTIGVLSALGFTLTAPGIAGLVLTIGMAVDTNVIIFERIKEELTKGKNYSAAVNEGYKRSLAPVLDGHITTLLTAIILAYFGLGPVLGFATTQIIGILLSLFCGILVSRLISDWYTNKNRHFEYFTGISKKIFNHANFKFIEYRKYAYMLSAVIFIMGIASFFHGFDEGVEFAGGRSYTVKFDKAVDPEMIRQDLKTVFGEAPIIKTVDVKNQVNITTSYKIKETGNNVDAEVERKLYEGLVKFLPAGTSFDAFENTYKQGSQTVLPTISDDLKAGATKATLFAVLVICLYIFIRFRDWRYSLGSIFALMHDVFVTLIVFSFLKDFVPFPLEIDQHFIAAILTVIGFSMNDTVIVYDRIREDSAMMKGTPNATIINRAINETLSRTIMTSVTVFLTILILFIFGGEVTRGFAFAMLIGVATGTYSSIFVAAPFLVDFGKGRALGTKTK